MVTEAAISPENLSPKNGSVYQALVVQMGARRGYELAQMLNSLGTLAGLQTSTAWPQGHAPSGLLRRLLPVDEGVLARRTVKSVPAEKIRTTMLPELLGFALRKLGVRVDTRHALEDWLLGFEARRRGLSRANVVLSTTGNGGLDFLRWAKDRGALIVIDVIITPLVDQIVAEERARWPGWEPTRFDQEIIRSQRRRMERLLDLSDLMLCPSPTVEDGLKMMKGYDPKKTAIVPYALGDIQPALGSPVRKRVLFAGTVELRKGVQYLAQAASQLKKDGYEFRVAGKVSRNIVERPECRDLNFLGHLSGAQMREEFRRADIFCLPSLAEGMASVTLEAMAYGLPCVVTRAAGAPVEDNKEGFIVAERNAEALTSAIETIVSDRSLRSAMSDSAYEKAEQHRPKRIEQRLHSALLSLTLSAV